MRNSYLDHYNDTVALYYRASLPERGWRCVRFKRRGSDLNHSHERLLFTTMPFTTMPEPLGKRAACDKFMSVDIHI